jgi:hypothetical protein
MCSTCKLVKEKNLKWILNEGNMYKRGSTQSTYFTWGYMSANVLLFKVILNRVCADHLPSLLVVLNFNLWFDNNNNPEQCNVPDGFRSNAISNRKPTLSQLCLAEGGQGRIQDLWLGGEWVGEGSGDRLGPQWVKGRALVVGPGGLAALGVWGITDIYLNDNFEPTTPFLSNQKNLTLSLNFVG